MSQENLDQIMKTNKKMNQTTSNLNSTMKDTPATSGAQGALPSPSINPMTSPTPSQPGGNDGESPEQIKAKLERELQL